MRHDDLRYAVLCYAMSCYKRCDAVRGYAMLCDAMLRYTIPCHAGLDMYTLDTQDTHHVHCVLRQRARSTYARLLAWAGVPAEVTS